MLDLATLVSQSGRRVGLFPERPLLATPFADFARERGLEVHPVDWLPGGGVLRNLRAATQAFSEHPARVIHFNISWRPGMWSIPIAAKINTGAALIGSMRAMPELPSGFFSASVLGIPRPSLWRTRDWVHDQFVGRIWARTLDLAVSVNRDSYPPRMVRQFGFRAARTRVIYNGVQLPVLESDKKSLRRNFGLPENAFVVAFVGRMAEVKGGDVLLRAAATLDERVHVLFVGEGPAKAAWARLADELGMARRVTWAGFVTDPYPLITASDVVAVPSLWEEAFGRVVAEALSCSIPVVASRVGGMAELFIDGEHGHYVPVGDVQALREAIAAMAEADPGKMEAMGRSGRRFAQEHYEMSRVAEQYGKLYDELTGLS